MAEKYTALAYYYDGLGEHIDYGRYAEFVDGHNKRSGKGKSGIALDLACGTGTMALELDALGYDTIGIDGSVEMLDVAREKSAGRNILYLCQDMRELDLYGTVDLVSCTLDSLNYITSTKELSSVFALVNNFLEEGGIFVFDLNTEYKFSHVYGNNSYVFEDEGVFCVWQNEYNEKNGKCNFCVSVFEEDEDGKYYRTDEYHTEKCHKRKTVEKELKKCGFELLGVYSDFNNNPAEETDPRHFYVARNILPKKTYEADK